MKWLKELFKKKEVKQIEAEIKPKYPNEIKNIWYNRSIWCKDEKYPKVFLKGNYIDCRIGNKIIMFETFSTKVYYEITNIISSRGGDFYYPSDAYNCDLKFSHIEKFNF